MKGSCKACNSILQKNPQRKKKLHSDLPVPQALEILSAPAHVAFCSTNLLSPPSSCPSPHSARWRRMFYLPPFNTCPSASTGCRDLSALSPPWYSLQCVSSSKCRNAWLWKEDNGHVQFYGNVIKSLFKNCFLREQQQKRSKRNHSKTKPPGPFLFAKQCTQKTWLI